MTVRPALLHGPRGFTERMRSLLAASGVSVREAAGPQDVLDALAADDVSVVVVDHASLHALGGVAALSATRSGAQASPVVAAGCPDSGAVALALASGARLAVRSDAGVSELMSLVRSASAERDLERERELAQGDLRRHAALVVKDDLTAAYNRRFFDRCIEDEIEAARRRGGSVALIFMDIDNLKAVNVRHGHPMGSLVLREAASRAIRTVREGDRVVRYGGDEFCIVLPGLDAREATEMAGAIRSGFASAPFAVAETGGVALTASFGIAAFPEHAPDAAGLVRAADGAMLRIKDMQRNGILVASEA